MDFRPKVGRALTWSSKIESRYYVGLRFGAFLVGFFPVDVMQNVRGTAALGVSPFESLRRMSYSP